MNSVSRQLLVAKLMEMLKSPLDRLNPKRIIGRFKARYNPHQGKREMARRLRQIDAGKMSITGR